MKTKLMMLVAAVAVAFGAWARSRTVGGYTWSYLDRRDTAMILAISPSPTGAVAIPSTLDGKPVTEIGDYVFHDYSGLTTVTIPNSVVRIRSFAFYNLSGLVKIEVEAANPVYKSVNGLLLSKDGLSLIKGVNGDVTIPKGLTSIGYQAFRGCSGLTSVTIPDSVTSIGNYAFQNCSGLESVTIPDSVTSIGSGAFYGCRGLTSVTIPNSVTNIGGSTFCDCSGLTSVTIPDGVTSIGSHAFSSCSGLTSVTIPDGVTSIGESTFSGCSGLTSVTIPNSVTNIGVYAFYRCYGLTSVTIPDSVTSINSYVFTCCSGLTSIVFNGDAPTVGEKCFYGVDSACIAYVRRSSTGWGVGIPGTWNEMKIAYVDDMPDDEPEVEVWTVTFNPNGGSVSPTTQMVTSGVAVGTLPVPTRSGYTFTGWFTAASGGTQVTASTVVSGDVTYYAHWTANGGGLGGGDTPTPGPSPTPMVYTVTFNANGGSVSPTTQTVTSGATVGTLPVPTRSGYTFTGWFTTASGGAQISASTKVTANATYYAHWTAIVVPPEPEPEPVISQQSGDVDTSFAKAQTVDGALYKDDALVGTVQVKAGKANKKKQVKLSATASLIVNGAVKKVTANAATVTLDAQGRIQPATLAFKAPVGNMTFEVEANGTFTLKNASYQMAEVKIGGALKGGSRGTFRLDDFHFAVKGELQDNLIPYEEQFKIKGNSWTFEKAATVKWAKDKKTKQYGLVVDDSKGKTNRSGLKLTYTSKTGQFKGSFKAYALETTKGKTKLVKYTVNVIGFVVDGVGHGEASCKKPAGGPWPVTVE